MSISRDSSAATAGRGSGSHPSASQIERWIWSRIAELTGERPDAYAPGTEFAAVGLSSKDAVLLAGELQGYLGRPLPPTLAWDYPSAQALAEYLASVPGSALSADSGPAIAVGSPPAAAPVAVVGMACRFPGAADAAALWSLLETGQDGLAAHGERSTRSPHGFLSGIDQFDAAFFAISDLEAAHVDPQQRLLLEAAWQALEDAAISPTALAGSRTGVFVGITGSDYGRLQTARTALRDRTSGTGEALSIAANRLSYVLDLRGPSLAVDTACSSSLVAVHLAVRSLRSGESDLALAAGVNVLLAHEITDILGQAGALAPDGRCKPFDASADGYVRSEGCGLLVLKRLPDAVADGDRVLGVIVGSAVGQDGRTNGLTAPSGLAQQAILRAALADARLEPSDIGYLETHGTGTALGDPIEVAALCAVYAEGRCADSPLQIGSVKANIGHAEAAAGIAGLIKLLLMLAHRRIPGQIHLRRLNPQLPACPQVHIPRSCGDWTAAGRALTAGVSSFGFGGTVAHAIVQEPPPAGNRGDEASFRPCHLLALSAGSQTALTSLAGRYARWLREHPGADLGAVARTTTLGRAHLRHRAAVAARTHGDAVTGLDALAGSAGAAALAAVPAYRGQARPGKGRLAMLFSGTGSQYVNMGRQLYVTSALFRDQLRRCQDLLAGHLDVPLLSVLFPLPHQRDLLDRTRYTQPAVVAVGYALAQVWRSWGVVPDLVLGHSLGEFTAACVAGALDLAEALALVAERGRLIEERCEPGSMATVFATEDAVRAAAAGLPPDHAPVVAAVNAPDAVVVAGRPEDVASFLRKLAEQGMASRPVRAAHAFHSPMMRPAAEPFAQAVDVLVPGDGTIEMVSDLDGLVFAGDYRPGPGYWVRQLTEPVRFAEGIRQLVARGCTQFLEVGPGRSLAAAGQQAFPDALWAASMRPGAGDWTALTDAVARLYAAGRDIDWAGFHRGGRQDRATLPGYPFERRRHWLPAVPAAAPTAAGQLAHGGSEHLMESQPLAAGDAPRTDPVLATLSRIVAALLGRQAPADPDITFLDLGADSMILFQILQSVQQTFGVSVGVGSLFEQFNTLNLLAGHIRAAGAAGPAVAGPAVAGPAAPAPPPVSGEPAGQFLRVHAQVMSQAYELLRDSAARGGAPEAGGPPAVAVSSYVPEPAASSEPGQAQDLAKWRPVPAREAFVPFRAGGPMNGALAGAQGAFARQLMLRHAARTRRSKELTAAERPHHSDARHAFLAFPDLRQVMYPVAVDRSLGARVTDVDGNEYIDLAMGYGVNLFGHQEPFIVSAITEQLARGMQLGPHSPLAGEVARLVCDLTGQQRAVFCNTGSEAVMVAIRLARAVTGRRRIALFAGSYHGSADPVLARQDLAGSLGEAVPMAPGITEDISRNALVLPYGEDASLDVLRACREELAAVLVEPVQSRRPDLVPVPFLKALRELTQAAGTPLIFDEVITGFRVHPGGVRALFGIRADMTTYGKVLGGGLPIGLVAGDERYLNAIDGGWLPAAGQGESVRTFFTGTFAKHPLALAAARAVLTELKDRGPGLQEGINARTENLASRLDAAFDATGIAARIARFGSLFRFQFPNEPSWSRAVELFYLGLVDKGLYVWEGRNCFLSAAHTDDDLDEITSAVARTAAEMSAAGFFGAHGTAAASSAAADVTGPEPAAQPREWPLSRVQREILALDRLGPDHSRAYTEAVLMELRGEVNLEALRAAAAKVLARHDSLHAVIAADGSRQRAVPPVAHLPLVDIGGADDGERQRYLASWTHAQADEVLDVTAGPPVRAVILRAAADHHWLYLAVHHLMIDGWSFGVVAAEIAELYAGGLGGQDVTLAAPAQYADHVAWERQREQGPAWEASLAYWQRQYADGVPELTLLAGQPAAAVPGRRLGVVRREIGRPTADQLPGASGRLSVTAFTMLLAAYGCLLHRLSGQDDLVIGVPFACRGYPGGDGVVGHCSTTLPVRSQLRQGTRARDYIGALHATLVAGYEHPEFCADMLPTRAPADAGAGWGIFSAQFNLDRLGAMPTVPGLRIGMSPVPRHFARAGLVFDALLADGALWLSAEYDADLFEHGAVESHVDMFERLLQQFIADPDAVLDPQGAAA